MKSLHFFITALVVGAFFSVSIVLSPQGQAVFPSVVKQVLAASGKADIYFGGPILLMTYCVDEEYFLIFVGPPANDFFIYSDEITVNYTSTYPSHIGQFILGMNTPAAEGADAYECTIDGESQGSAKKFMIYQGTSI